MSLPYRIALVCTGNICRSPMAEAVLRRILDEDYRLGGRVVVDSFGTGGWHVGEPADPRAVAALRRRGYDIAHRARRWDPADFAERDLVVALDRGHLAELRADAPTRQDAAKVRLLRSFDPAVTPSGGPGGGAAVGEPGPAGGTAGHDGGADLDVPDPYYGGAAAFDRALDLIENACRGLARQVHETLAAQT
jgi:protein-tyrosine phosphatase